MLSSGWRKSLPDNPPVSEAQDLVRYLNRFELVAVAIFENAMDEKIYKFARRTDRLRQGLGCCVSAYGGTTKGCLAQGEPREP